MNLPTMFTSEELNMLSDRQFFSLKKNITEKLAMLMHELSLKIANEIAAGNYQLYDEVILSKPKISKGENYLGYPWMVLDYPRVFRHQDIFAFRSLCWWGHEFSFTLHIGGSYLQRQKLLIAEMIQQLKGPDIYICIHNSPWHYHFVKDNYQLLADFIEQENNIITWLEKRSFVKISKKSELDKISEIPQAGIDFFQLTATLLLKKNSF